MENISLNFSNIDIETSLFCLSVFPTLNVESTPLQAKLNSELCNSVSRKLLLNETRIPINEVRVLYLSLTALTFILDGDYSVDDATLKKCNFYSSYAEKIAARIEPFILYHMKQNK